jgi:hypothetical protein
MMANTFFTGDNLAAISVRFISQYGGYSQVELYCLKGWVVPLSPQRVEGR